MNKLAIKMISLILLLVLATSILSSCSSGNYSSAKPGQCMWCDGYGYYSYYDANNQLRSKTCSHCHGTGRSN